jgi:hypothetical protein
MQTTSPKTAAKHLFREIVPSLDVSDEAHLNYVYNLLQKKWGCRVVLQGIEETLFAKVISNLRRTTKLQGFQFFLVQKVPGNSKDGEIITFADGDGVSINACRTNDRTIYIYGNYFFQ